MIYSMLRWEYQEPPSEIDQSGRVRKFSMNISKFIQNEGGNPKFIIISHEGVSFN